MSGEYNKIITYKFELIAESPLYFGGSKLGNLVKDSRDVPILFGNSIGGALRSYLNSVEMADSVYKLMGGSANNEFVESKIYISDGEVQCNKIFKKEGTQIEPSLGSAKENNKYTFEYIPKGSIITFQVECEVITQQEERDFNKVIGTWRAGFDNSTLKFGGQQSNGFGMVKIKSLEVRENIFSSEEALNKYIFSLDEVKFEPVKDYLEAYKLKKENHITFSMQGSFPYGVYQNFVDKDNQQLTGLQKSEGLYYLPATSIKGLIRNEVRILLSKFLHDNDEAIEQKVDEIFGNQEAKGRVVFYDVVLENGSEIKTKRYCSDKKKFVESEESIYIKIDRLTGAAFDGAMKRQKEVCGNGTFKCQLVNCKSEDNPYIFPLIYVLNRIGRGLVPVGGRTSIGLGQFFGKEINLNGLLKECISIEENFSSEQTNTLKEHYNSFERWCRQC